MRRGILLLTLLLSHAVLYAQPDKALRQGETIRKRMVNAFGGDRNISKIKAIEYTVIDNSFRNDSSIPTRTIYHLDLKQQHIIATSHSNGKTTVRAIDGDGAWKQMDGMKEQLAQEEKEQLEQTLFSNFLAMLQNKDLRYEYLHNCQYKGHSADVVRVTNPHTSQHVSLFVSRENATVLASTRQDTEPPTEPMFYRDEGEYRRLGQGIYLPHTFQLYVNGELASEGRIVDIKLIGKGK